MIEHSLAHGEIVLLDDCDKDLLVHCFWLSNGYVSGRIEGKFSYLHRLVLERVIGRSLLSNELTDHINGDRMDNRRCNLRLATDSQNMMNRRKQENTSSPYIGVVYFANAAKRVKRWKAYIVVNKKQKTVGYFHTAIEAAKARDEAAKQYYGEFARLNNV